MHASLWDDFVARAGAVARVMRQAPPLNGEGNTGVDMGALVLPGEARRIQKLIDPNPNPNPNTNTNTNTNTNPDPNQARRIQKLIDEAVAAGATVVAGGVLPAEHMDQVKDGPGVRLGLALTLTLTLSRPRHARILTLTLPLTRPRTGRACRSSTLRPSCSSRRS